VAKVAVKLSCVLFVLIVGGYYVNPANWKPIAPYGYGSLNFLGFALGKKDAAGPPLGMLAGAAIIFFSCICFDAVSTQAEEARNPSKVMPIGTLASLFICTLLYITVIAVRVRAARSDGGFASRQRAAVHGRRDQGTASTMLPLSEKG
jgi:APA family basic amino acid/polyamine antiporter